jgi:hypothetical protein
MLHSLVGQNLLRFYLHVTICILILQSCAVWTRQIMSEIGLFKKLLLKANCAVQCAAVKYTDYYVCNCNA